MINKLSLPCLLLPLLLLLLLIRVPLTGSALGWATAMGVVLVMVVMVAAGNISVDMSMLRINLIVTASDHQYEAGEDIRVLEFLLKTRACFRGIFHLNIYVALWSNGVT